MSLTRGGTILIGLAFLVMVLSLSFGATVCIVTSSFAALLLLNIPCAWLSIRGLSITREHASHVKEGADFRVALRVANRTRNTRLLLQLLDQGPGWKRSVQIPLLAGGQAETAAYTCRAGRRGVYHLDACQVESSSPFGLVNARRKVNAPSDLVVYPLYYELTGALFGFRKSYSGMTSAPASRPGEGASFFGLREYREGDPIRKIHWASTVRARRIMVKEFEEDLHSSIVILLDTYRPSRVAAAGTDNFETAIRTAASLANYTLVNGHPTTLITPDATTGCLRHDKATGDLTPILDSLARVALSDMKPLDLIASASASLPRHSNLMAILLSADRDAMEDLLRVRAQGIEVILIIVDALGARPRPAQPWLADMLALFDGAGINTLLMSPEDDIQTVLSRHLRPVRRVNY